MKIKSFSILCVILLIASTCSININTKDLDIVPLEDEIVRQPALTNQYPDYWSAIQHFDFDYVNRNEVSDIERNYAHGLEMMTNGEFEDAQELFTTLLSISEDSLMRNNISTVLQALMTNKYEWNELVTLDSVMPDGLDEENTVAFAKAFSTMPPERIIFPDKPTVLATTLSLAGVPVIEVLVNGQKHKFWIDTGAEMSVLASDVAQKCHAKEFKNDIVQMGTSTEIVIDSWPGAIEKLQIGDITIENHPIIVLDKKDLEFRLFKIFRILKVEGILGWNAIRQMEMELDYKNGLTTIKKPKEKFNPDRNFHCVGVPYLSLTDTLGTPFNFFMDTGANKTSLYEPSLLKVDTLNASKSKSIVGGAGGNQTITHIELPKQAFVIGQQRLNFGTIDAHGDGEHFFLYFDGVIGSDIAKNGTLILDFQNGRCELKLSVED